MRAHRLRRLGRKGAVKNTGLGEKPHQSALLIIHSTDTEFSINFRRSK